MSIEPIATGNQSVSTAVKPAETAATPTPGNVKNRSEDTPAPKEARAAQKIAQPPTSTLEFSIDPDTGRAVVKIFDTATRELVRQMPMEEMLALAKSLDQLKGLLLHAVV
jgi:flagellar protein FlaG